MERDNGQVHFDVEGPSRIQYVFCVTVLRDGLVASGSGDKTVKVWELASGQCNATLAGHEGFVSGLGVLGDGRLVSSSEDGTVRVWDVAQKTCVATLEGHDGLVLCLAVLGDGRFASGAGDMSIKFWSALADHPIVSPGADRLPLNFLCLLEPCPVAGRPCRSEACIRGRN